MTGKEALKRIGHLEYGCDYLEKSTPLKVSEEYKTIEKELDELSKYKKAVEILVKELHVIIWFEEDEYFCNRQWLLDGEGTKNITKEEYELLEELMKDAKD